MSNSFRPHGLHTHTHTHHELIVLLLFSHVQLFSTPWTAACRASVSITNFGSLLTLRSIESVMPSSHLILCRPLLLLPSNFPSIRVFSNESVLYISWPRYWSFSFSISPSNGHSGLISFWWTGWISLQSKDSQESSPASQFKNINSLLLSFLQSPTLTSIHDYWKNHSGTRSLMMLTPNYLTSRQSE